MENFINFTSSAYFASAGYVAELLLVLSAPVAAFALVFLCAALFGNVLWRAAPAFFLIDELIWFLYNPVRFLLKNQQVHRQNWQRIALQTFIIKPLYQLMIYIVTTPLRIINALYFDIFIYIWVMANKSLTQLFRPNHRLIRHSTGIAYLFWCILLCPLRLMWALGQNMPTIIDAVFMAAISIAFPTFRMLHGTSSDGATCTSKKASLRTPNVVGGNVAGGNAAGSNNITYFSRNIRAAKQQTTSFLNDQQEIIHPIILARVNFGFLRNFGAQPVAQATSLPSFAAEFWQEDIKSWGYY